MSAFSPAAVMSYTDIHELKGLDKPADYGSGIEYVNGLFDSLFVDQGVGLQLGLWLNGTKGCDQINKGLLDDNIEKLMSYLKRCRAVKVFLRVGYEFDNPSFQYLDHPDSFVEAYLKIFNACTSQTTWDCRDKVKFVWQSWASSRDIEHLSKFYPGTDFVDWIGVSIFQQLYPWSKSDVGGRLQDLEAVLDFAVSHGKPIMIAESTPFGGINMHNKQTRKYDLTDPWQRWFVPVLDLIDRYDIAMWSYINCDWDVQRMWRSAGFGDTRLSTNQYVQNQWRENVLHGLTRPFLHSGTLVDCSSRAGIPLYQETKPASVNSISVEAQPATVGLQQETEPIIVYKTWHVLVVIALFVAWGCLSWYFWRRRLRRNPPGEFRSPAIPHSRRRPSGDADYEAIE
jgi:hypothetical protein